MNLDLVRIFVKVAQNSSFTKAAFLLKVPKSTISKAITRLEEDTGTQLLLRTTRSLTLTAAGRKFYEASLGPIQLIEDAQKSLEGQDNLMSGLIRITASEDLGFQVIAPLVSDLTIQNPLLSFELHYTDQIVDLVKDGFDLAVRIGRIHESSFKIKKVGEIFLVCVAAPKYLKNKEKIKAPDQLAALDCLSLNTQAYKDHWALRSPKGKVNAPIHARASSNQMSSLLKMAVAGGGIALIPKYLCQPEIDSGQLVRVLPDWTSPGIQVSIISPMSSSSSARLKLAINHIHSALKIKLQ